MTGTLGGKSRYVKRDEPVKSKKKKARRGGAVDQVNVVAGGGLQPTDRMEEKTVLQR